MRFMIRLSLMCLFGVGLWACEEEFIPEISTDPSEIVVEGYIESGEFGLPPYVLLTRSLPFFSTISFGDLDDLFVHDAVITIDDGEGIATLEELCWADLDSMEQVFVSSILGQSGLLDIDTIPGNFCVYFDQQNQMRGQVGRTYDLRIEVEDKVLTATTTIPEPVPVDILAFVTPAGTPPDTLVEMRGFFMDPPEVKNFYRYFTSVNLGRFIPGFNSVANDNFFDGQVFEFPIPKGEERNTDVDPDEFGLFTVGDTITLKWTSIDEEHFNFWNTLEFNSINQGPFSTYTRVESNVNGGLGVWGGYSALYYTVRAER